MLDVLDRKILAALDENARQPDSTIGKRLRASKQVVRYRIKRLEEAGVIAAYYALLDVGALGMRSLVYVYLQLRGVDAQEEHRILEALKDRPDIGWLVTCAGRWDAILLVFAEDIAAFNATLTDLLAHTGGHVHECAFSTLLGAEHLSYRFLGTDARAARVTQRPARAAASLDAEDVRILSVLDRHARSPVTELARLTGVPTHTVRYRIRQLEREGVILGYKPKIDPAALGYQWYLLLVQFDTAPAERQEAFIRYCVAHDLVYYVTHVIGTYSLMLDLHLEHPRALRDLLRELKQTFADVIKTYDTLVVFEERKISYMPVRAPE